MIQSRLEKIYRCLGKHKLDGLLVTKKVNVIYLSGLCQMEAYLLVSAAGNYYITDFRYLEEAQQYLPHTFTLVELKGPLYKVLNHLVKKRKLKKLGFETNGIDYGLYKKLKENARGFRLVETKDLVEDLRQIKDESELKLIRQAIEIAAVAWRKFIRYLEPRVNSGKISEKAAADRLEYLLRQCGASKGAFDLISACGPNASRPHATISHTLLTGSQPILFDFGVVYQGYHCDITRNFLSDRGRVSSRYRRIYRIVRRAQQMAIEAIKPGEKICHIDRISRRYITNKGLGKYFGHAVGHGVGLEVHESPGITGKNRKILRPGMVFTVEPGVYIPGWGGVRIEDMIVVTQKGCEVLTNDIHEPIQKWDDFKD